MAPNNHIGAAPEGTGLTAPVEGPAEGPDDAGSFVLNADATRTQFAALCWRVHRGKPQVLLVTSRETRRWIVPKGWPIDGLSPEAAALQEAWEEAGVEGVAQRGCLGLFTYDKVLRPDRSVPCLVAVYAVKVGRLRHRFPERKERRREWVDLDKAALRVDEDGLRRLIADFSPAAASSS